MNSIFFDEAGGKDEDELELSSALLWSVVGLLSLLNAFNFFLLGDRDEIPLLFFFASALSLKVRSAAAYFSFSSSWRKVIMDLNI